MAHPLIAAVDFDWQLPSTPSFSRSRRQAKPLDERQCSLLAWVANYQAPIRESLPPVLVPLEPVQPAKAKQGRPVRLRLYPDKETRAQRAERIATSIDYAEEMEHAAILRPRHREDCMPMRRALVAHIEDDMHPLKVHAPCPWVSCEHHLHIDVHRTGDAIGMIEVYDQMSIEHTCALDFAESGGLRRTEIAVVLGMTQDRTLVMEKVFLQRVREQGVFRGDLTDDDVL